MRSGERGRGRNQKNLSEACGNFNFAAGEEKRRKGEKGEWKLRISFQRKRGIKVVPPDRLHLEPLDNVQRWP